MTTELNLGSKTISVWLLVAIIAGIVAFITLFLNWMTVTIEGESLTATALDLFNNKVVGPKGTEEMNDFINYAFVAKLPLIIAILGIVGAIVTILPTFVEKKKELSIVVGVIFLIAVILSVVYLMTGTLGELLPQGDIPSEYYDILSILGVKAGIGAILAVFASIIGLVVSAVAIRENF